MGDIGYYIMIGLLVAGAAYGLANKDKPKPPLTKSHRNILVVCVGIVVVGALLLLAVVLISHGHVQQ